MQALDQFLRRGDLQEGFADEGTKKRQILVGDAAAPAIELLLEGDIFFNHSQGDQKRSLFRAQILLKSGLQIEGDAKK